MRSATLLRPPIIILFMNACSGLLWYLPSGTTSRRGALPLRGMLARPPGAVLAPTPLAVGDAGRVERAANDVVADAGQVLHATAADEDDRVLLKAVALSRDVGRDLHGVGQAHPRDLPQRRVRLLRRHRPDLDAHPPLLRR